LYALQTFFWALIKDFFQLVQFANENADKQTTPERVRRFAGLVAEKVLYVTYLIVIPKLVLHISWAEVFIGFLAMHLVAGFVLTLVFQLAHVVESTQFPEPDNKGNIAEEWAIHQMQTTADFAPANKLVTFYVGGLNYQVEHHLFQRICHIHYPAIAPIVKQTAQEYGVPYLCNPTFADAVRSHFRFINQLGIRDTMRVASDF
jgi:linoleoyl-CoA desaturase